MDASINRFREPQRRPLRTYSKRTEPHESSEPPIKRRRVSEPVNQPEEPKYAAFTEPVKPVPRLNRTPSHTGVKKGTIMSYFKVVTSSSSSVPSSDPPSDCALRVSSPPLPSSPPQLIVKPRKPRRLTTRPTGKSDEANNTKKRRSRSETEDDQEDEEEAEPKRSRISAALSESSSSAINQSPWHEARLDSGKRGSTKRQKSAQASVQTTISLSLAEKAFTECEECGMLYNPLHDKDLRYHARRHAAVVKSKA